MQGIEHQVSLILSRWPDAVSMPEDNDREKLALEMKRRVAGWDWEGIKTARVNTAAFAVFDKERAERDDLAEVRSFYIDEIAKCPRGTFLDTMVWVYIDTFEPKAAHTKALAKALDERQDYGTKIATLLEHLPELFQPREILAELAKAMLSAPSPYSHLKAIGIRSPHTAGLTLSAHREFVKRVSPKLKQDDAREQLLNWLIPEQNKGLQADAGHAVEALLKPWRKQTPPDDVRHRLTEAVISEYKDPRLYNGGIWASFDPELKNVLLGWLTQQDMRFFCDTVSATQNSHMWPPRRDFWLEMFEDGRIEQAWVAFGADARKYAQRTLLKTSDGQTSRRFGRQVDRSGTTSLLIMKIGSKIVVDGCHNYRTHIFKQDDPKAPSFFQSTYYCDDIMRAATKSKSHSHIHSWSDWVLKHV